MSENRMSNVDIARAALCPNTFRRALESGKLATTLTVFTVPNYSVGQLAANAGFVATYVDMEHSVVQFETAAEIFQGTLAAGRVSNLDRQVRKLMRSITPLCRVPLPSAEWVTRALDAGAVGITVPHIECAEDAAEVVRNAKFAPLGERSVGGPMPMFRSKKVPTLQAQAIANEDTIVICMLESQNAIDHAEEIAAVKGVDVLHIGTNDLSEDMGIPFQYENPRLHEQIYRVCAAAKKAWKDGHKVYVGVGAIINKPDLLRKLIVGDKDNVIRFVSATDYSLYAEALEACATTVSSILPLRN